MNRPQYYIAIQVGVFDRKLTYRQASFARLIGDFINWTSAPASVAYSLDYILQMTHMDQTTYYRNVKSLIVTGYLNKDKDGLHPAIPADYINVKLPTESEWIK